MITISGDFVSWLGFFVNMGAAGGFVLACALYAKRIGGVGPWLVASVGAIDALLILMFRVIRMMGRPSDPFVNFELRMLMLDSVDAFFTMLSAILVLVGFALMMPKTRRA